MNNYLGAIDQGTTSTRFIVFDKGGRVASVAQKEHEQIFPQPGWVEHNPEEIWQRTQEVISEALAKGGLGARDLAAIGITNQRETTVVWEKATGKPVMNAIVWQDTRVAPEVAQFSAQGGQDRFRTKTGLPLSTYFSGLKLRWILKNVKGAEERAKNGELLFGNIDAFLLWNLSGGPKGGVHATDVTNASRTQLLNLKTLDWDDELLSAFGIPSSDAAESAIEQRSLRSSCGRPGERGTDCRNFGRPAGGAGGTSLFSAGRNEKHIRHRLFPLDEHGRAKRGVAIRAADDGGV